MVGDANPRGIVFDVQRASLHDGPGIRTTIFLKGCPLHCSWCHNPESIAPQRQLYFHGDRCVSCGACEAVCVNGVHRVGGGVHAIAFEACLLCGKCVNECITDSLRIIGRDCSVDELMHEILADRAFYDNSGGGVTLSGGEPLFQLNFALELLKRCKQAGVHTCVETSGFAAPGPFMQMMLLVDLLLFDYKATSDDDHRRYTGVSKQRIMGSLEAAYQCGVPIILRCPVIPGVNDTAEHFRGIRELDHKYPRLRGIELLPYHTMGNSKRTSIGIATPLPDRGAATDAMAQGWLRELHELGCEKVTIG